MEQLSEQWEAPGEKNLQSALSAIRAAGAALPPEHENLLEDLKWIEESILRELEVENGAQETLIREDFYTPEEYCA